MEWMEAVSRAVSYIEEHITEELTIETIAKEVNLSLFYFQRGFAMLCGFTIGEYIRSRRLALAGNDLGAGGEKIIDIALKYGYDSPDSFTRTFTRFHGVTPKTARKGQVMLKTFAPLKIKLLLEGGYLMDCRIVKKEAFIVLANATQLPYEGAKETVPRFWKEHYQEGKGETVKGMYGINIDETMGHDTFQYLIADPYDPATELAEGFVLREIPAFTWVVFPRRGPMPSALQDVNTKIFTEWLPALKEYEFAAVYCVERYEDASRYPKGILDETYYCEIWIPVKRK